MTLAQYNKYFISTVNTDGLLFQRQDISSHNAEHAPMCFQLFKG